MMEYAAAIVRNMHSRWNLRNETLSYTTDAIKKRVACSNMVRGHHIGAG